MRELYGRLPCKRSELDLFSTLMGGQCFRWKALDEKKMRFAGIVNQGFWEIWQSEEFLEYKVFAHNDLNNEVCNMFLNKYFRLEENLSALYTKWRNAHNHFEQAANIVRAVRILDQDPLENVISFICSQNNNIKRITSMIEFLCSSYGTEVCINKYLKYYTFPTLQSLQKPGLETELKEAKFGYRAKFIANAVKKIQNSGGIVWLESLRSLPYDAARNELLTIPGVGPKVADCICLMSLNHLESVPIDTHIFKIAKEFYGVDKKSKNISRKLYDEIATKFRNIYGNKSGWAQAVLFCSDLPAVIK